jgi:hypothetical protein
VNELTKIVGDYGFQHLYIAEFWPKAGERESAFSPCRILAVAILVPFKYPRLALCLEFEGRRLPRRPFLCADPPLPA